MNALPEVIATGNRRAALEALRDHLSVALVEVDARYKAPLAKQLTDTIRELDSLADAAKGSPLDDLAAARAARRSAAGL